MEITQLGRTGLKVSRLCLGTMNFGSRTPEEQAHEIMNRALGEGVGFCDTADIYGPNGLTEEIVGRWRCDRNRGSVRNRLSDCGPRGRAARNPALAAGRVDDGAASVSLAWIAAVDPGGGGRWRGPFAQVPGINDRKDASP